MKRRIGVEKWEKEEEQEAEAKIGEQVFTQGFIISPRVCIRENCFSCKPSCQRPNVPDALWKNKGSLRNYFISRVVEPDKSLNPEDIVLLNCPCKKKFAYGFSIHPLGSETKCYRKMTIFEEKNGGLKGKMLICSLKVICQMCKRLFTREIFSLEMMLDPEYGSGLKDLLHKIEKFVDPINNPYIYRNAKVEADGVNVLSSWSDTTKELIYCGSKETIDEREPSLFLPQELVIIISNFIWMFELVAELVYYKSLLYPKG